MSLRIVIKTQRENQPASSELFSPSPEKKARSIALRVSEENTLAPEASVPQGRRSFKPVTSSEQQLLTSASHLIEKAKKIFAKKGPSEESIKLCMEALEIPSINEGLRNEGLYLLGLIHDKRARTEAAHPCDLEYAIKTQEVLLEEMGDNFDPIFKARLQYMIARNVFKKALQQHELLGVERAISIVEGILAQDCLTQNQRIRIEANLAKAVFAKSSFVTKEDEWLKYLI